MSALSWSHPSLILLEVSKYLAGFGLLLYVVANIWVGLATGGMSILPKWVVLHRTELSEATEEGGDGTDVTVAATEFEQFDPGALIHLVALGAALLLLSSTRLAAGILPRVDLTGKMP